jgi:FkbM family methyltransferase
MNVLIKFRHGLGDAVQLTAVLSHVRHYHPAWEVDVAALVGKHSAFHGLCRRVYVLDREPVDEAAYQQVFDLEWPECYTCYADWPGTKAEGCLLGVFGLNPVPDHCRYVIHRREGALSLARRYLQSVCKGGSGRDGRYPAVLIHYEGNTSREHKDLPVALAGRLCQDVIECGLVPVILDWDRRTPLADGLRIHNPDTHAELWGGTGTGDAEALAALTELSALMVGVDSGPLHVAGATGTPAIGVWLGHHPVHYFAPAANVTHLVPENHADLLRGDRRLGEAYFGKHYRHRTYRDLEGTLRVVVREALRGAADLVYLHDFWVRSQNVDQDLVIVRDIAEEDSYRVDEFPLPGPVVVDVGAHIGCFSQRVHGRNPQARIIAVECCPENIPALERNVARFATVLQAAVTYEKDLALLNAVYPHCVSTGGSTLICREELRQRVEKGGIATEVDGAMPDQYWADFRPVKTLTLEQLMEEQGLGRIDVLKLDCEGSEFSILGKTTSLDRIGLIVGEYHDKEAFLQLVRERFTGWDFRILRDGEPGTFWLRNLSARLAEPRPRLKRAAFRFLVAAMQNQPQVAYSLLLLDQGTIAARYQLPGPAVRGFAHLEGKIWAVDARGNLYQVLVEADGLALALASSSPLAREAHDLAAAGGRLWTASLEQDAVVSYDPATDEWAVKRPWVPVGEGPEAVTDRFHLTSVLPTGACYLLSLFSGEPRPPAIPWREAKLDDGLILRWGPEGFAEKAVACGLYAPHSLRRYQGQAWWCDSFRRAVCREDGWRSADLGGFTRGLAFSEGRCAVGLSRSRVPPHPFAEVCGVAVLDAQKPEEAPQVFQLGDPFTEVFDVIPIEFA